MGRGGNKPFLVLFLACRVRAKALLIMIGDSASLAPFPGALACLRVCGTRRACGRQKAALKSTVFAAADFDLFLCSQSFLHRFLFSRVPHIQSWRFSAFSCYRPLLLFYFLFFLAPILTLSFFRHLLFLTQPIPTLPFSPFLHPIRRAE